MIQANCSDKDMKFLLRKIYAIAKHTQTYPEDVFIPVG